MKERIISVRSKVFGFAKENKHIVLFLTVVYFVALLSLLRANYNYRDDVGRVLLGNDDWSFFGRWTTNILSHFVHADSYLRDISPLTQIIAVIIMVAASIILLKAVRGDKKLTLLDAACVLPLGLFPYFLCCFSYKFDAPYMALSVLFSILPLAFRKKKKIYYIAAFVCTLLMCTTYQASAGIFAMLVVFTAFLDWKDEKKRKR